MCFSMKFPDDADAASSGTTLCIMSQNDVERMPAKCVEGICNQMIRAWKALPIRKQIT